MKLFKWYCPLSHRKIRGCPPVISKQTQRLKTRPHYPSRNIQHWVLFEIEGSTHHLFISDKKDENTSSTPLTCNLEFRMIKLTCKKNRKKKIFNFQIAFLLLKTNMKATFSHYVLILRNVMTTVKKSTKWAVFRLFLC